MKQTFKQFLLETDDQVAELAKKVFRELAKRFESVPKDVFVKVLTKELNDAMPHAPKSAIDVKRLVDRHPLISDLPFDMPGYPKGNISLVIPGKPKNTARVR